MFKFRKRKNQGITISNFSKKNLRGFTLIELLVVIAVIGLLISIILVAFGPARKKGRDAKGQADLRQILSAFEMKYSDDGVYPDLPNTTTAIPEGDTRLSPYLNLAPHTSGLRAYYWYDGGDNQKLCVYFQLEIDPNIYFYVSYNGTGETNSTACPNF